jgi:hypothetical protein
MAWEIQKTNHGREASRPQKLGGNETRPFFSQAKWRSRFKTISSWMEPYGYFCGENEGYYMDITRKWPWMRNPSIWFISLFPECIGEGFSFYFGRLGVETCSLDAALPFATVHKRPQTVRNHLQ